jgi:plasmid stabilization system protein ParE
MMRDTHRVILTEGARNDLKGIAFFIRQRSPQNAASVAEAILKAIDSLAIMPDRFKQIGISRKRGSPIHAMVVRPFILYYRIDNSPETVHVLYVVHGARRQPRRFE